jgi:hypothetical protein
MKMSFLFRKRIWVFLSLITWYVGSFGQIPVSGKVTSAEDNQGMPGVNVLIKGTNQGVITGSNGTYTINIRNAEDVLVFSFVGFNTEEITVGSQTTLDVTLVPSITSLETVVVMGYSSKKRNEITSAVTTVTSDKLKDVTANDIGTMLQVRLDPSPTFGSGVFLHSALPKIRCMLLTASSAGISTPMMWKQ